MHDSDITARRIRLRFGCFALAVFTVLGARAQTPAAEEAVEAAYLHKFPGFVDWPADSFKTGASPIVIGLVGAPRVLDELARIAHGRLVLGRPVDAISIGSSVLPRDLHVLFIGRDATFNPATLIDEARRAHVLVVTDLPDGLKVGAAIEFVQVDGRIRFDASPTAARRAELKLNSNLLSVAAKVVEDTP